MGGSWSDRIRWTDGRLAFWLGAKTTNQLADLRKAASRQHAAVVAATKQAEQDAKARAEEAQMIITEKQRPEE